MQYRSKMFIFFDDATFYTFIDFGTIWSIQRLFFMVVNYNNIDHYELTIWFLFKGNGKIQ